jgi:hypothetical protein
MFYTSMWLGRRCTTYSLRNWVTVDTIRRARYFYSLLARIQY